VAFIFSIKWLFANVCFGMADMEILQKVHERGGWHEQFSASEWPQIASYRSIDGIAFLPGD
jgi:hypothetical protein